MRPVRMIAKILTMLLLATLTLGQQGDECGGPLSFLPFDDIGCGAEYYIRCTFPTYKLAVGCILASCPLLQGVCPLSSQTALNKAVSILNQCVSQKGPVCGINLAQTPMVQISWTTGQVIPCSVANGSVNVNSGSGSLNGLSTALFSAGPITKGLITLSVYSTSINNTASYSCLFRLPPASFLQPLAQAFPLLNALKANNMQGVGVFNVSATVTIDLSVCPPAINTLDDLSSFNIDYTNFVDANNRPFDPKIEHFFNFGMNYLLQEADITAAAKDFLSTFAALALQGAQEGCP